MKGLKFANHLLRELELNTFQFKYVFSYGVYYFENFSIMIRDVIITISINEVLIHIEVNKIDQVVIDHDVIKIMTSGSQIELKI